jgi:flagellar biosynthesis/type III secretory pathway protein FliH
MGEIVNLRRVKKQRAREAAAQEAAENRVRHGWTKAAKQAEAKNRLIAETTLDGAALPPDSPAGGKGSG